MTWCTLWKRLGKQPLSITQHNPIIAEFNGELYEMELKYFDNGTKFKLIPKRKVF